MKEANKITEGALLTAIYIVLLLVVVFVPFMFFIGLAILPVPFIVYAERYGMRPSLIMFFVTIALTLFFATFVLLPITLLAGIGGIVIGSSLHRGRKPYETWARGTIGYIMAMIIITALLQFALNINVYDQSVQMVEESLDMTKSMMATFNVNVEQMDEFALIEEQMRSFPDLLPASIAITSIFLALASMWFSFKTMNAVRQKNLSFPPFREFALPKGIIWLYIVALFATLFIEDTEGTIYIAALNASMLIMTLLIIQGFSFLFFYGHHKKWPRYVPVLILVFSLLIPFISMLIIRFIGIIDILFDLKGKVAGTNEK